MSASLSLLTAATPGALLNPGLLGLGAALAAIPIIIHLLNRRRVRRVRWAAMHWLMAAMKRHQRRLRLENWLILFLRVAALVLLGLALARPVVTDSALAGLVSEKRSVYLVLDNSFSTLAKLDARSVFEQVKQEADLVLRSIGSDDATAVIVTNDPDLDATNGLTPHVLMGRSVGTEGATRAREAVAALKTRDGPADWAATLERLQEQMADEDVNRHVILVTDLQAKDWLRPPRERVGDANPTDDTTGLDQLKERLLAVLRRPSLVRVIDVGGADRRDLAVLKIENRTGQDPFVGRPLRLAVTVANYGKKPVRSAQIEVQVDGEDRKRVFSVPDLPAAETALRVPRPGVETVQIDLPKATFTRPGSHTVRVVVTPPRDDAAADSLGLSSERWLALEVRRRVHVVAWSETSRSEQNVKAEHYLRGIYEGFTPGEGAGTMGDGLPPIYAYQAAHTEAALLSLLRARGRAPVDLVVLANVVPADERLVATLREYVNEGGGLLVFAGDRIGDPDALNSAFYSDDASLRLLPFLLEAPELRKRAGERLGAFGLDFSFQEDPHPLAEPFTNVKADDWIKRYPPAIWGRMTFREPAPITDGTNGGGEGPRAPAADADVVLRFRDDGKAAVVASRFGEGRTVWVGTSIDNGWMATAVLFLPVFLEEAAMFLTRPADAGHNLSVGGMLEAGVPADAERVRFTMPGGGQVSPIRRATSGPDTGRIHYRHADVGRAGIWRLTYQVPSVGDEARTVFEDFAVNPDATEGSLFPAAEDALRDGVPAELDLAFLPSFGEVSTELEKAREGEISRFVLWLLLAVLLLESLLALKFGRRSAASQGASTPGS